MNEELMAAIDVMAYGYEVSVSINGADIGISGGKSQSLRLMGRDHPMASRLPDDMKNLACLQPGENELEIAYKRTPGEDSSGLTIEIKSEEQFRNDEKTFFLRRGPDDDTDAENVTDSFTL